MSRLVSLLATMLVALTACGTAVAGTAVAEKVVGVTQRGGDLEVTPLVLLDPAPLYKKYSGDEVEEGTRLVALRLRVTNRGSRDDLVGPTGTVGFFGSDGEEYLESFLDTSAGPMFDQLRLAPEQTIVGYLTIELPDDVTLAELTFETGTVRAKETLRWDTAGQAVTEAPEAPSRKDDRTEVLAMGDEHEFTGDSDGVEVRMKVRATRVIDPAEPTDDVRAGTNRRLVGVEFAVENAGAEAYDEVESDADLRIFGVHNAADEFVRHHLDGATEVNGMPLRAGGVDTWTVLFEVPEDFVVDRVSYSSSYGRDSVIVWATN
jgi:hypothetical protein